MTDILTYRNRTITENDVAFIRRLIERYPQEGRCALSRRICVVWDWKQPNGHLKDMICRGMLLLLEKEGLVNLPPRKCSPHLHRTRRGKPAPVDIDRQPIATSIQELPIIELRQVRRMPQEAIFNGLVEQHHYLGYSRPVGEHLKYIALTCGRPIACIAFSSSPYALGCRDAFIGWSAEARSCNRHLLAYNTRFLILPWVRVPHLASHLLSLCSRQLSQDWQELYRHPIYWIETFVDTERFAGTCYKAANWIFLGLTSGRGKYNKTHQQLTSIKAMYGYPLIRDFRRRLCHG